MTTNAALAFCSDAWLCLILNVFWGAQGGGTNFTGGGAALPAPPLGTAPGSDYSFLWPKQKEMQNYCLSVNDMYCHIYSVI